MSRSKITFALVAAAFAALFAVAGAAQAAKSLDELLQEVKNVRAQETELNAKREREFWPITISRPSCSPTPSANSRTRRAAARGCPPSSTQTTKRSTTSTSC